MSANVSSAWFLSKEEKEMILTVHEAGGKNIEMEGHLTQDRSFKLLQEFLRNGFPPRLFRQWMYTIRHVVLPSYSSLYVSTDISYTIEIFC